MKKLLVLALIITTFSCAAKQPMMNDRFDKADLFSSDKILPIKDIVVKDFLTNDFDINRIPKNLIVTINLLQPVTLTQFFQLLINQGISFVIDLGDKADVNISVPAYHGELKTLLKTVQLTHGLFFGYDSGVVMVKSKSPVYCKVLMPGTDQKITDLIKSFGVESSYYDQLSSRIVFTSDYFTFKKINDYFKNNGYLSLVYFDVMILEKQDESNFSHGFDWSQLAGSISNVAADVSTAAVKATTDGMFSLSLDTSYLSLSSVIKSIDQLQSFDVVQSARISALNGSACTLDASEKIPFVTDIDIEAVDGSDDTKVAYTFDEVSAGLVLKITPSVIDNIVSFTFKATLQSVNEYLEVGTQGNLVSQPVAVTRDLENQVVIKAGQTALIGGLKYNKTGFTKSALSWSDSGYKTKETKSFLVSILIRSQVVRYVFV